MSPPRRLRALLSTPDDKLAEIDPMPVIVATPSIKHAANILKLPLAPFNSRKARVTYIGSQF